MAIRLRAANGRSGRDWNCSLALVLLAFGLLNLGSSGAAPAAEAKARATFAGGCFWSMEQPFDQVRGVLSTTTGYAGGRLVKPSYEQVASGGTGHAEVVQVLYDTRKVSYEQLLAVFWRNIDPFDAGGQFCDRGSQYRSAIFYEGEEQKAAALASRDKLASTDRLPAPIATEVVPLTAFYPAEAFHQDFYVRNVRQYWTYRTGCGRDERLRLIWGEPPH